ncbi:MAG TPA: diaminopimelate decarboxylase, partial [Anaerovoracaceae bacterium]|nr:diaminopimelate decarboxylase [Anaerovoracaceae bacterium]
MYKIKNHLEVSNDHLTIGGCDSVDLVKQYGSPLFVINENRIRDNLKRYRAAFPDADMYYAAKANGNLAIMRILALDGAGADVFSGGELYLAILAGIERKKILFNGNSKTDAELTMAIETGVRVSVDSIDELRTLAALARKMGKTIDVAFRVNPDVSATTHPKIATGLKSAKFGIPHEEVVEVYREARDIAGVNPVGIHCHIGSQILDVTPFGHSTARMMDLVEKVSALGIDIEFVDIGSGLGIPYEKGIKVPTPTDLAAVVLPVFNERCAALGISPKLILEPGRYIVGDAVVLLTTVNTMKAAAKNFVGIDAGF